MGPSRGRLVHAIGLAVAGLLGIVATLVAAFAVLVLEPWYVKLLFAAFAAATWLGVREWYLRRWPYAAVWLLLGTPATTVLGVAGPLLVLALAGYAGYRALVVYRAQQVTVVRLDAREEEAREEAVALAREEGIDPVPVASERATRWPRRADMWGHRRQHRRPGDIPGR